MFGRLQFVARSVVFIDAERNSRHFRLRRGMDGASSLEPRRARGAGPHLCVLAQSLVYRRRVQSRPLARRGLESLLRAAGEYFPAGLKPASFCLLEDADGISVCALAQAQVKEFEAEFGPVQALLVGPDAPSERDLLGAIERRHRLGAAADLASRPVRIAPAARVAFAAACTTMVAIVAAMTWFLSAQYPGIARLSREVAAAEATTGDAARQYESILKMIAARRAIEDFGQGSGVRALDLATAILRSVPAGHSIRSVELKNGELSISGTGSSATEWLAVHGVPAEAISTYRLQQADRFTAKFPLPRVAPRGS